MIFRLKRADSNSKIGMKDCVRCCNLGDVEDLKHFILECPAYQEIRQEFACIFIVADGCMVKIFNYSDTWKLCQMLEKMEAYRIHLVPKKKQMRIKQRNRCNN